MPTSSMRPFRMLTFLFCLAGLASCGGDKDPAAAPAKVALPPASPVIMPKRPVLRADVVRSDAVPAGSLTSIVVENTSGAAQPAGPLTFGQVFAEGHLLPGD